MDMLHDTLGFAHCLSPLAGFSDDFRARKKSFSLSDESWFGDLGPEGHLLLQSLDSGLDTGITVSLPNPARLILEGLTDDRDETAMNRLLDTCVDADAKPFEGIEASDLGSLLLQFEEAAESQDDEGQKAEVEIVDSSDSSSCTSESLDDLMDISRDLGLHVTPSPGVLLTSPSTFVTPPSAFVTSAPTSSFATTSSFDLSDAITPLDSIAAMRMPGDLNVVNSLVDEVLVTSNILNESLEEGSTSEIDVGFDPSPADLIGKQLLADDAPNPPPVKRVIAATPKPVRSLTSKVSSPCATPPRTPPPEMIEKIKSSVKRKSTIMLPMSVPSKRGRGTAIPAEVKCRKLNQWSQSKGKLLDEANTQDMRLDHDYCARESDDSCSDRLVVDSNPSSRASSRPTSPLPRGASRPSSPLIRGPRSAPGSPMPKQLPLFTVSTKGLISTHNNNNNNKGGYSSMPGSPRPCANSNTNIKTYTKPDNLKTANRSVLESLLVSKLPLVPASSNATNTKPNTSPPEKPIDPKLQVQKSELERSMEKVKTPSLPPNINIRKAMEHRRVEEEREKLAELERQRETLVAELEKEAKKEEDKKDEEKKGEEEEDDGQSSRSISPVSCSNDSTSICSGDIIQVDDMDIDVLDFEPIRTKKKISLAQYRNYRRSRPVSRQNSTSPEPANVDLANIPLPAEQPKTKAEQPRTKAESPKKKNRDGEQKREEAKKEGTKEDVMLQRYEEMMKAAKVEVQRRKEEGAGDESTSGIGQEIRRTVESRESRRRERTRKPSESKSTETSESRRLFPSPVRRSPSPCWTLSRSNTPTKSRSRSRSKSSSRSRSRSSHRHHSPRTSPRDVRPASRDVRSTSRDRERDRRRRPPPRERRHSGRHSDRSRSGDRSRSSPRSRHRSGGRTRRPVSRRSRSRSRSTSVERRRRNDARRERIMKQRIEERRIVYVGALPLGYEKSDLERRFIKFGAIEEISLHKRDKGDNYGFVTYNLSRDAFAAIAKGNEDPKDPRLDLCFGGRREFCKTDYADLDGNQEIEEECLDAPAAPVTDFDLLLRQFQKAKNIPR